MSKPKKAKKDQAYKKCPGCGHTYWDLPAKQWGETAHICHYCIEDELEIPRQLESEYDANREW
jgi:hypothetical protein